MPVHALFVVAEKWNNRFGNNSSKIMPLGSLPSERCLGSLPTRRNGASHSGVVSRASVEWSCGHDLCNDSHLRRTSYLQKPGIIVRKLLLVDFAIYIDCNCSLALYREYDVSR